MLKLLLKIGLVSGLSKLICIFELECPFCKSFFDLSPHFRWKSGGIDTIWIVEKLMLLRVDFNVLPSALLPTAGNQVHKPACRLIFLFVILVSRITISTVVDNWLAMSWFHIILFLSVRLNLRCPWIVRKGLHLLSEIFYFIFVVTWFIWHFWKNLQSISP